MTASSFAASTSPVAGSQAEKASEQPAVREIWWDRERLFWGTCKVLVPVFFLNIYLLSLTDVQPVSAFGRYMASVTLWLSVIPLWVFFVSRRRMIPFPAFASALYVVYFTFPVFGSTPLFLLLIRTGPAWESMDETLVLVVVGMASMLVGLYGTGPLLGRVPQMRREMDLKRALPMLAAMGILSFMVRLATFGVVSRTFGSILYLIGYFGQISLAALIVAWLRGYLNLGYKALTVGLFLVLAAVGFATGLLAEVAIPLSGFLFTYCWERRRIPWGAVTFAILLFIPLNAAKVQFRSQTQASSETNTKLSPAGIANLAFDFAVITYETLENGDSGTVDTTHSQEARTNQLGTFATVVSETPRVIPYWDGYTYSDLTWKFVPRVIVPNKPAPAIGQEFPRRYELIDYFDYTTSCNLPQLVELYINFGPVGVVFGMAVIGFIYALLEQFYSGTVAGAIIGCTLFSGLMNMESNFSMVFGSLPLHMLLCGLLIRFFPMEKKPALTAPA